MCVPSPDAQPALAVMRPSTPLVVLSFEASRTWCVQTFSCVQRYLLTLHLYLHHHYTTQLGYHSWPDTGYLLIHVILFLWYVQDLWRLYGEILSGASGSAIFRPVYIHFCEH